ncbi:MAG: family 16 glycosylhydrolase [Fibrobacter sp.]|nr:family 16 glycosylhydrolase [Fibrobacter sp.]
MRYLRNIFISRPFLLVEIIITGFISSFSQISYENYELVWYDEFDIDGLPDEKKWSYETGCSVRNSEFQYYAQAREKNSRIENGNLIIEAHKEPMNGCNYTSANLLSKKRDFKYGLYEIRAKIDIRQGSWPAWWWLPNSGGWPRGGEIDMMEYYKENLLFNVMDGNQKWTSVTRAVSSLGGNSWAEQFHVWTWEWDSLKINLYLDGTLMNHYPLANANGTGPNGENPFRRPGYMLINQAIGGNNGGDPSGTTFPVKYIVDYVRVYQAGKDTTPPRVVSVRGSTAGTITVVFSESIEKTDAEKLSTYTIGTSEINLLSVKHQEDERTVVITTSGLSLNDSHQLTIKGIKDRAKSPNTLDSITLEFSVTPESKKLSGRVIGNGTAYNGNAAVTYDKAIDGNISSFSDCTGDQVWVGYDFGANTTNIITGFRFYPRSGYTDRMTGKSFEISTDGITWEKVYTIQTDPVEGSYTTVSIESTKPVRFVRYNGTGGYLNVCEIEFWGYSAVPTSAVFFNGRRFSPAENRSLLYPPFTVTIYSLGGRKIFTWKSSSGAMPVQLSKVLDHAANIHTSLGQIYIVSIGDLHKTKIWYRTIHRN